MKKLKAYSASNASTRTGTRAAANTWRISLHFFNYGVGGYIAGGQHTFPAPAPIFSYNFYKSD